MNRVIVDQSDGQDPRDNIAFCGFDRTGTQIRHDRNNAYYKENIAFAPLRQNVEDDILLFFGQFTVHNNPVPRFKIETHNAPPFGKIKRAPSPLITVHSAREKSNYAMPINTSMLGDSPPGVRTKRYQPPLVIWYQRSLVGSVMRAKLTRSNQFTPS